jgi:hypothetical protein
MKKILFVILIFVLLSCSVYQKIPYRQCKITNGGGVYYYYTEVKFSGRLLYFKTYNVTQDEYLQNIIFYTDEAKRFVDDFIKDKE